MEECAFTPLKELLYKPKLCSVNANQPKNCLWQEATICKQSID